MQKEDLIIIMILLALILAAIITIKYGGEQSLHGYGHLNITRPGNSCPT